MPPSSRSEQSWSPWASHSPAHGGHPVTSLLPPVMEVLNPRSRPSPQRKATARSASSQPTAIPRTSPAPPISRPPSPTSSLPPSVSDRTHSPARTSISPAVLTPIPPQRLPSDTIGIKLILAASVVCSCLFVGLVVGLSLLLARRRSRQRLQMVLQRKRRDAIEAYRARVRQDMPCLRSNGSSQDDSSGSTEPDPGPVQDPPSFGRLQESRHISWQCDQIAPASPTPTNPPSCSSRQIMQPAQPRSILLPLWGRSRRTAATKTIFVRSNHGI
ncbi:uncharacterized protein BJ171DRAFT_494172, partial [Polychytrium aggregatum]|uniref:uncharacterized protein n=1 Tax=Polychytrium aggregatum TaxID=110093 RepID=UPI0022FE20E3